MQILMVVVKMVEKENLVWNESWKWECCKLRTKPTLPVYLPPPVPGPLLPDKQYLFWNIFQHFLDLGNIPLLETLTRGPSSKTFLSEEWFNSRQPPTSYSSLHQIQQGLPFHCVHQFHRYPHPHLHRPHHPPYTAIIIIIIMMTLIITNPVTFSSMAACFSCTLSALFLLSKILSLLTSLLRFTVCKWTLTLQMYLYM